MNIIKTGINLIVISLLASCSASYKELSKLEDKKPINFQDYLHLEYKTKAIFEAEEMHDWDSAKLYSEKAIESLYNEEIYPEKISHWQLPKNSIDEILAGHKNLYLIYDSAKISDPNNLAKAIVSLDCWSEQQEEKWQTWDINKCKEDFINSLNMINENISLSKKIDNNKSSKPKKKLVKEEELITHSEKGNFPYIVYFDFDKYDLSNQSIKSLDKFIENNINLNDNYLIIGHTDTKGSKSYNMNLSLERAKLVKKILIKNKIDISKIKIEGKGEESLAIITPDNTKHPANRRVEIKRSN